jgi:CheY-like chemotaxis protein
MTKLQERRLHLSLASFDFRKMLQNVQDILAFEVENKCQRIEVTVDDAIPENFIGDRHRLAQIITNLLDNANKFTPQKGFIRLDARLAEEKGHICTLLIAISDNGIGIAGEQQARLFSPFEQLNEGSTNKYGGTGLGLTISSRLVEMMGGKLRVDSTLGKGSTFTFAVKLRRDSPALEEVHAPAGSEKNDFSGFHILLADDVEINREIVISLLEPAGLKVDCAADGKEAVRMFCESPLRYHLIFMDLQMPEMNGLEATREIRASSAPNALSIPIVAMTANAFEEDVKKCLEAGMNKHLGKPLDMEAVWNTLCTYLIVPKMDANA